MGNFIQAQILEDSLTWTVLFSSFKISPRTYLSKCITNSTLGDVKIGNPRWQPKMYSEGKSTNTLKIPANTLQQKKYVSASKNLALEEKLSQNRCLLI